MTTSRTLRTARTLRTLLVGTVATLGLSVVGAGSAAAAELPAAVPASAPAAATTTGSVTADLTVTTSKATIEIDGTKPANVTCTVKGKVYTVISKKTSVDGYSIATSMVIRNYTGPGAYTASVTLTVKGATYAGAGAVTGIPVTITDQGGSWNFSKTASGAKAPKLAGATLAGTLSYGCNS